MASTNESRVASVISSAFVNPCALALRQRTVGSEMIAWPHVITLPLDAPPRERDAILRRRDFTRFPVVDKGGNVVGILSLIDAALRRESTTESLMTEPVFLSPDMAVRDALRTMRTHRHTMVIVRESETRRPLGIITLKDLVEPLTGELAAW